jgi:hypothetical protein
MLSNAAPTRCAMLLLATAGMISSCLAAVPPEPSVATDLGQFDVQVTADTLWTREVDGPFEDRTYLEVSIPVKVTNRTGERLDIPLCRGLGLMASLYRLEGDEWQRVYARPCPAWDVHHLDPGDAHHFRLDLVGALRHDFTADPLEGRFRIVLDMTEIGGESIQGMGRAEGEAWRMRQFGSNTFILRDHRMR